MLSLPSSRTRSVLLRRCRPLAHSRKKSTHHSQQLSSFHQKDDSSGSSSAKAPVSLTGWCFDEPRDSLNGFGCGAALLDGDYRTSWPHFGVPQQYALAGTLAYLKGGLDELPRGVTLPPSADGRVACTLLHDIVVASRLALQRMQENGDTIFPEETIFDRSYDLIVPLPSSGGPGASVSNQTAALAVASAFSPIPGGDGGPQMEEAVLRVQPMKTKSTKTDRNLRKHRDAPRRLHFSNMLIDQSLANQIKGTKILLWDDVCTWGNTSEAARNLLFMAGASRVDVITAFSTGPVTRAHTYRVGENGEDSDAVQIASEKDERSPVVVGKVGDRPNPDRYIQDASVLVSKDLIEWAPDSEGGPLRDWHEHLGSWVEAHFPHFVPNEIPF